MDQEFLDLTPPPNQLSPGAILVPGPVLGWAVVVKGLESWAQRLVRRMLQAVMRDHLDHSTPVWTLEDVLLPTVTRTDSHCLT